MTVGIVGLGLIGGSVGLALRTPGRPIIGWDPDALAAEIAHKRFCVDRTASFEEVAQADVVFVCAPPPRIVECLERLAQLKRAETVVTDVGSVKSDIVRWAVENKADWFVPGHPMAGHEKSSAQYASAWMFRNAKWILTPARVTGKTPMRTIEVLVREMGAEPVKVEAEEHDRHVAVVSHLPHVLAGGLVKMGSTLSNLDAAAGSWKDLTRVGGVDPGLWTDILTGNRSAAIEAIRQMELELVTVREALEQNDVAAVRQFFTEAQKAKK